MKIRALKVGGALEFTPRVFADDRGEFLEYFRSDKFREATGISLALAQANCSISRKGVLRGLHYADVPPGQAKYVTCFSGAVVDVVVDIRIGSPTFGRWDEVQLDDRDHRVIYLPEGVAHAFLTVSDHATVAYLCSTPYDPTREREISPLDPDIGITWPADIDPVLSAKDAAAPTLTEARAAGLLPSFDECAKHYEDQRQERGN